MGSTALWMVRTYWKQKFNKKNTKFVRIPNTNPNGTLGIRESRGTPLPEREGFIVLNTNLDKLNKIN